MKIYFVLRHILLIMLATYALVISEPLYAGDYNIIDLSTSNGSSSNAKAINDRGQIIGESRSPSNELRSFFWDKGQMIDLGTLGGDFTRANAINNRGQVIGASGVISVPRFYTSHAFLWERGKIADMGALTREDGKADQISEAIDINDRGEFIGTSVKYSFSEGGQHVLLWSKGKIIDISKDQSGRSRHVEGINDRGQIIFSVKHDELGEDGLADYSTRAFLWDKGNVLSLDSLSGVSMYDVDKPTDINQHGQVVGFSKTATGEAHIVLWENGGVTDFGEIAGLDYVVMNNRGDIASAISSLNGSHAALFRRGKVLDLGTLGGCCSYAIGINDKGQIIGSSETDNGEQHAFLWDNGKMTDLGTLGGDYSYPADINRHGQIVGVSTTSTGESHAVLWQTKCNNNQYDPN